MSYDPEIERILIEWTQQNRSEFCPKCIKVLGRLKTTSPKFEKYIIAQTLWENAILEGKQEERRWLEYEICRMLHGWTLEDQIRFEREKGNLC